MPPLNVGAKLPTLIVFSPSPVFSVVVPFVDCTLMMSFAACVFMFVTPASV